MLLDPHFIYRVVVSPQACNNPSTTFIQAVVVFFVGAVAQNIAKSTYG